MAQYAAAQQTWRGGCRRNLRGPRAYPIASAPFTRAYALGARRADAQRSHPQRLHPTPPIPAGRDHPGSGVQRPPPAAGGAGLPALRASPVAARAAPLPSRVVVTPNRSAAASPHQRGADPQGATPPNNFYEFGTAKDDPANAGGDAAHHAVDGRGGGHCAKPGKVSLEDLLKGLPPQERIYRMRCVEGWSIYHPRLGVLGGDAQSASSRPRRRSTSRSPFVRHPRRCPAYACRRWTGPYRRACASTRPCIPLTLPAARQTAAAAERRRRCGWSCRGSTASRGSSRSSRHLRRIHAEPPRNMAHRRNTGFIEREPGGGPSALETQKTEHAPDVPVAPANCSRSAS